MEINIKEIWIQSEPYVMALGIGGAIALGLGGKETVREQLEKRFKD